MRRSDVLAEELISAGKCPIEALVRLAQQAEAAGDVGQAIGAWKCILPYIYPRPKAVETQPELVVDLARTLASVRSEALRHDIAQEHVALLERYLSGT
ncbi:hypothetical protein LZA78_03850 [Sinirhodobacter sp. WL0062]|uniref:Uncharacterized protein n=1 Tax=Rhodobacter flavimaris TaxID=2907145 RepID=A0ABS8YRU8_9RHOB|nr:hypothetical protein [Sinirhodobacter sp. WL0062]MCE5972609.1 hypothetical protein [Sinirhodobacter sp. WL0062]